MNRYSYCASSATEAAPLAWSASRASEMAPALIWTSRSNSSVGWIKAFISLARIAPSRRLNSCDMELNAEIGRSTRSEEHTSELQSLMRNSYDVFCLKKKKAYISEEKSQHEAKQTLMTHSL